MILLRLFLISALWLFSLSGFGAEIPAAPQAITLGVGQQLTLTQNSVKQISIGDPSVLRAHKLSGTNQILLTALKAGATELLVWEESNQTKTYPIRIVEGSPQEHANEIREILGELEGITVRQIGDKILVEGKALRPEDIQKVDRIARLFPNAQSLVTLDDEALPVLADALSGKLRDLGFQGLEGRVSAGRLYLIGGVASEEERLQALDVARAIFPDIVSLMRTGGGDQPAIKLRLHLAEINRSHLSSLGIEWNEAVKAAGEVNLNTSGNQFGLSATPEAILHMIEDKGWGKILSEPNLLCRSGEKARFVAGGEIPIRLISERSASLIFKPYGIILEFSPRLTQLGEIGLTVDIEVSTIDGGNSIEGIPAFLTRKLTTAVTLATGKSLVLGGLVDHNQLKNLRKVPLLGGLPVLGELFKSRYFRNGESELLIFIEPEIQEPNAGSGPEFSDTPQHFKEAESWFKPKLSD